MADDHNIICFGRKSTMMECKRECLGEVEKWSEDFWLGAGMPPLVASPLGMNRSPQPVILTTPLSSLILSHFSASQSAAPSLINALVNCTLASSAMPL